MLCIFQLILGFRFRFLSSPNLFFFFNHLILKSLQFRFVLISLGMSSCELIFLFCNLRFECTDLLQSLLMFSLTLLELLLFFS